LQGIVHAVADEALNEHIPFDHCCLYLPAANERKAQVWRASRSRHDHVEDAHSLGELPAHLSDVFLEGQIMFFGENELHGGTAEAFGMHVRSALALPLSDDANNCFGALCFTSRFANAYTAQVAGQIEWITEAVSSAVLVALKREEHHLDEATLESQRLKRYVVRTLVRDVRLPLSGIVGVLKTLEDKINASEPLTSADRQLLRGAVELGERVCVSVDDHLEVTQDADRTLHLQSRRVTSAKLIEEIVETVRVEASLSGVGIEAHVAADTPDLFVDARQAARLLMHVLDAALLQTHEGGRIWVEAHGIAGRRTEDAGHTLCRIDITEDGAGLPPEDVPYIFDAFRPSEPTPRNATNSNVGLAIARRIAVAHGGNISARSSLGVGTIYSITLPAAP
jgi:signal transduction histidine kinase